MARIPTPGFLLDAFGHRGSGAAVIAMFWMWVAVIAVGLTAAIGFALAGR